jgi:hypothetical protein
MGLPLGATALQAEEPVHATALKENYKFPWDSEDAPEREAPWEHNIEVARESWARHAAHAAGKKYKGDQGYQQQQALQAEQAEPSPAASPSPEPHTGLEVVKEADEMRQAGEMTNAQAGEVVREAGAVAAASAIDAASGQCLPWCEPSFKQNPPSVCDGKWANPQCGGCAFCAALVGVEAAIKGVEAGLKLSFAPGEAPGCQEWCDPSSSSSVLRRTCNSNGCNACTFCTAEAMANVFAAEQAADTAAEQAAEQAEQAEQAAEEQAEGPVAMSGVASQEMVPLPSPTSDDGDYGDYGGYSLTAERIREKRRQMALEKLVPSPSPGSWELSEEAAPSPEPGLVGVVPSPAAVVLDDCQDWCTKVFERFPDGSALAHHCENPECAGCGVCVSAMQGEMAAKAEGGQTLLPSPSPGSWELSEEAAPSPEPGLVGDTTSPLDDAGDLPAGDWNMQPSPSPKPDGTEFDPPALTDALSPGAGDTPLEEQHLSEDGEDTGGGYLTGNPCEDWCEGMLLKYPENRHDYCTHEVKGVVSCGGCSSCRCDAWCANMEAKFPKADLDPEGKVQPLGHKNESWGTHGTHCANAACKGCDFCYVEGLEDPENKTAVLAPTFNAPGTGSGANATDSPTFELAPSNFSGPPTGNGTMAFPCHNKNISTYNCTADIEKDQIEAGSGSGILYPEEWDEDIPEGVDDEEKVFMIKSFEGKSPEQRRAMKKQFEKMSEADKEAIEHHLEHSPHHTVCFDWCDAKIAASPQAHANFCKNIQCAQCESCKCGDWCEPYFNQFPTQAEHYCGNAECWGCSFCEEFAFASASNNSAVILVTPRPPPTPPYPPSMPDWDSIEWGSGSGAVAPSPAADPKPAKLGGTDEVIPSPGALGAVLSPEPGLVGDPTDPLDQMQDPVGVLPSPSPISKQAAEIILDPELPKELSEEAGPSPDPDLVGDTTSPLDDAGDLPPATGICSHRRRPSPTARSSTRRRSLATSPSSVTPPIPWTTPATCRRVTGTCSHRPRPSPTAPSSTRPP